MILDFFTSNGIVLWTLIIIAAPWIAIGVVVFFVVWKIIKHTKRKKEINQIMNEMNYLEADIQAHQDELMNTPTKNNVITFPMKSHE